MQKLQNYINGELVAPVSGRYIDNYDPAIGEVYSLIPDSGEEDVQQAVAAAQTAFEGWSLMPAEQRSRIMLRISTLIEDNLDRLAKAESVDNGKPVSLATQVDIPRAAKNFWFYATGLVHYSSQAHAMENSAINYTLRHPLGVVGCISPWNLPLYLFSWKIAPALAAGNCVVAKPSEITPMTAYLLSEICQQAGLPKGVLNIIHGYGHKAGAAIVSHPQVKAISFTGGTKTGEAIAREAAPKFKKLSLELGGKNPNIIFADCNYEQMLETTLRSSFANQGQICLCGSRIFVEKSLYEKFKKDFIARVKEMRIGDPAADGTRIGAVVSESHMNKILSYIDLAQQEGGILLTGGKRHQLQGRCVNGYFVEPTVVEGLSYDCRVNQEEIFGPVVTIMPFETEEEVLKYANSVQYGLSSTVWTESLNRATRLAQQIEAGIVWVNCWLLRDLRTPFGGVKASGVGREGGFDAMEFFTEPKNVCIKIN
ncbi:aldehyde dehydrogenase [uncultured Microscilla sp.]|uniref:aldehyde dehydrogenase n=1 Tax=uncultured Microscilla sp. TaxID=432653 RepID=UPI00262650FA|nr:aldehyde dehydrogenase [uncultured Microscilla sp.]